MTAHRNATHDLQREIAAACLRQAGLEIDWQSARFGYRGKWTAPSADGSCFIKLASSPPAAAMLRREIDAYRVVSPHKGYRLPALYRFEDCGDWAIAVLERIANHAMLRASALVRRAGPFEHGAHQLRTAAELMPESAREGPLSPWRKRLLQQLGNVAVEAGPSHGDFIYWNIGVTPNGGKALFDLEYYRAERYKYFDRLYWSLLPLVRQAARHPLLAKALTRGAPLLAAGLLPRGHLLSASEALAMVVLDHAAEVDFENRRPDLVELIGTEELTQRKSIVSVYMRILEGILG